MEREKLENQTQPARQRPAELPRPRGRSRHRRAAGPRGALSAPRCGSREEHCRGAFVRPARGPLRPGGGAHGAFARGRGTVSAPPRDHRVARARNGLIGRRTARNLLGFPLRVAAVWECLPPCPGRSRGAENCSPFLPTEGNDRPHGSLRLLLRLGRSSRGFAVTATHSGLAGPFSNSPLYQSVLNRDGSHQTQSEK